MTNDLPNPVRIDWDKATELLVWNTRRCLCREIAEKQGRSVSSFGVCLMVDNHEGYLVKEALTRIRRFCAMPKYWFKDEEAFGAWFGWNLI